MTAVVLVNPPPKRKKSKLVDNKTKSYVGFRSGTRDLIRNSMRYEQTAVSSQSTAVWNSSQTTLSCSPTSQFLLFLYSNVAHIKLCNG